jgi:GrpB-like predicted nucleotidyltransferase (UPF0157 family)
MHKKEHLIEKAVLEKYKFKPFSKDFLHTFADEKKLLSKALKGIKGTLIEHVGSTAIHGLGGKGIVDVLVFVPKKKISLAKKLISKKAKFKYVANWRKRRYFFQKYYSTGKHIRLVHVHLTSEENEFIKLISLVDYLKKNKRVRKKYESIKRKASELYWTNGEAYRKFKKKFLSKIAKEALRNFE